MKKLLIFSLLLFCSCSIKIPNRFVEDNFELANAYDQDLGSQIIKQVDKVDLKGRTLRQFPSNTRIIFKDKSTNDRIIIKFKKGTHIDFNLKFTTVNKDNLVYPKIEELNFNSSIPIYFKHNGKKLGSFSNINTVSNEKIRADIKSLSIANLLFLYLDNYLLSKNSPKYELTKSASKFPNINIEHLRFEFDGLEILEDHYVLKIDRPYHLELLDFELGENLNNIDIGKIALPLSNATINTEEINLKIKKGSLDISDYCISLLKSGYSIKKKTKGMASVSLSNGKISSNSDIISEGSFKNLKIDLSNYDYKAIKGNSIVNGSISVNGNIRQLKNNYKFRTSKYYYVLRPFQLSEFVVYYSDDGQGNIKRNFNLTNGIRLKFRDLYFQDFGQYEFFNRGVTLNIPPSKFERIKDITLNTKGTLNLSTESTQIDIYSGSGKRIKFPEGLQFQIDGIDELRILENITPKFDTINISGKFNIITEELDSSRIVSGIADARFKIYEENSEVKYDGVLIDVEANIEELKSIPQVFRGSKIKVKKITYQEDGTTSLNGLEILLPKKYVKAEMQKQLRKNLVKDYGRVGEIKVRIKKKIKFLFKIKFQWTVAKIGVYVQIFNANLNRFRFTGSNAFDFAVSGRVRVKTKNLRETKNIRELSGKGTIDINPGSTLDKTKITVNVKGSYLDIENFPGEIEQTFIKKALSQTKQTITFSPFQKLSNHEKEKLKKVVVENNIKISENGKYFIFSCNAKINP